MVTRDEITEVLRTIDDPEMAINIVDLGLVETVEVERGQRTEDKGQTTEESALEQGVRVAVEVLPTFVGCHALSVIESDIRRRVGSLAGVSGVDVRISYSPPWDTERITTAGREVLRRHGIMVPAAGVAECPWCGSTSVRQENAFGPTRCRTIWYCDACRNPFEQLKRVSNAGLMELSLAKLKR